MTVVATSPARPVDRARWDQFVEDSPQGSVFATAAFLDALDLEWSVATVGVGPLPAAAAIVLREPSGEIARSPVPFTQYQGVLLGGEVARAAPHRRVRESLEQVDQLVAALRAERRLSWCLHHAFTDVRAFSWLNYHAPEDGQFRVEVRYTGLIALDPSAGLEPVLTGSRPVRRQEYRKAAARFRVESIADVGLLDRLHEQTFLRQGLVRATREVSLLRSIAAAAIRGGFGEILAAFDGDGQAAGAVLFLFDRSTAYYLVAANHPEYRATGVSTLLFLSGVERGIARGVRAIDVVGMNSPSRGDFKTSFGAVPVAYYQVHWERP